MAAVEKQVYVISDLHIGGDYPGAYPDKDTSGGIDFRMFTRAAELAEFIEHLPNRKVDISDVELVINGDFIDFVAERRHGAAYPWSPVKRDPEEAARILKDIASRRDEKLVFKALEKFLADGGTLTVLIGNHDVELAYPSVQAALGEILKVAPDEIFPDDSEAFQIERGTALITHGNQYDDWNEVDREELLETQEQMEEDTYDPDQGPMKAPEGSRLVAEVMNPIKKKFSFVDLLKPEMGATIPLLMALAPDERSKLDDIIEIYAVAQADEIRKSRLWQIVDRLRSSIFGDRAAPSEVLALASTDAEKKLTLEELITMEVAKRYGPDTRKKPAPRIRNEELNLDLSPLPKPDPSDAALAMDAEGLVDRVKGWIGGWVGKIGLLLVSGKSELTDRLPFLRLALNVLQDDDSFNLKVETEDEYLNPAQKLLDGQYTHVLLGHTHLAKKVPYDRESEVYINTGTWANLMKVPSEIFNEEEAKADAALRAFAEAADKNDVEEDYVTHYPYYALIDLNANDGIESVSLNLYEEKPQNP